MPPRATVPISLSVYWTGEYISPPPLLNFGSFSPNSIINRYHNPEASLEEGLETLRRCIDEVEKRLVVSQGKYIVKIVDKDGARVISL